MIRLYEFFHGCIFCRSQGQKHTCHMFVESTRTKIDLVLWTLEFPRMLCALRCLAPPQCWQDSWTWKACEHIVHLMWKTSRAYHEGLCNTTFAFSPHWRPCYQQKWRSWGSSWSRLQYMASHTSRHLKWVLKKKGLECVQYNHVFPRNLWYARKVLMMHRWYSDGAIALRIY